jgi:penicillin-binding protein 2
MKKNARTPSPNASITRRTLVIGGVQVAAVSTLIGRLYYLQFLNNDKYRKQADENRMQLELIPPLRGIITDRNHHILASNRTYHRLLMVRDTLPKTLATLGDVEKLVELTSKQKKKIAHDIEQLPKGRVLTLKDHLSWEEIARIEFNKPSLSGILIEPSQTRDYPLSEMTSHVIGYIGRVSEKEQDDTQPVLSIPDFKIGKNGIEKSREARLQGKAGLRQMEVNVLGVPIRELHRQESVTGITERLTIDMRLQQFAAKRLGTESGAIIVLDIPTGDILAMTSLPAYDPNVFSLGIPNDYWKALNDDKKSPLLNKAITGQYPPGSTFKMVTGLAALEKGIIGRNNTVHCPGYFYLGNKQFRCWKKEGHGSVNIIGALAGSCDTFFYTMAQRMGIQPIADTARLLGLGVLHDVGIPGEKTGIAPDPAWKMKTQKLPWYPGETINSAIGQGDVLATPFQLAIMAARIASGKNIIPRLFLDDAPRNEGLLPFKTEHLDLIREGMYTVCNTPRGTAYSSRIQIEGFEMAGKTGTSQVKKLLQQGRDQSKLPWEDRHHALFVGYAPAHAPKYAAAVIVEHGGGGASAAAPIVSDVLKEVQLIYAPPTPTLTAVPPAITPTKSNKTPSRTLSSKEPKERT